jgi:hypothetical protein
MSGKRPSHIVIPDTQVKPGVRTDHLEWIGRFIAEKQPSAVIHLGDHYDMPSLSSYDRGKGSAEGRRVRADIDAGNRALERLSAPFSNIRGYSPRLEILRGNHEQRIERYVNDHPELEGAVGYHNFNDVALGWTPRPFLAPVTINGITYCHYFPRSGNGTIGQTKRGAPSARQQVLREMRTCIAGHQQGLDTHIHHTGDRTIRGIIAGSCLAPHHKVLTADLRYISLGDVRVGDKLVSFDEESGADGVRSRRYKTGTVEAVKTEVDELFAVTLSTGKVFHVTADHLWLVRSATGAKWLRTDQMYPETQGRAGSTHVPQLLEEWAEPNGYAKGWLAGMYDGEGCLYQRETSGGVVAQLGITQKVGPTLERIRAYLLSELGITAMSEHNDQTNCTTLRVQGGRTNIAKVLGSLRPERLLAKFRPELLGRVSLKPERHHSVVSIEPVGKGEIVRIAIDAKTMVVEGYGHHNCYLHEESYLSPQGTNYWRGILLLHEINRGNFSLVEVSLEYLARKYRGKK